MQVSSTVHNLSHQVEAVAETSAAAVAELSTKLDSLQSDVGQMKQLLMALLERQQLHPADTYSSSGSRAQINRLQGDVAQAAAANGPPVGNSRASSRPAGTGGTQ